MTNMTTYQVTRGMKTADGLTVYDFSRIPQEQSYIKVHGLFLKNDKQAISKVASLVGTTDIKVEFIINAIY